MSNVVGELELELDDNDVMTNETESSIQFLNETSYLDVINHNTSTTKVCQVDTLEDLNFSDYKKPWTKLDLTIKINRLVSYLNENINEIYTIVTHSDDMKFASILKFKIALLSFLIHELLTGNNNIFKEYVKYDSQNGVIDNIKLDKITYKCPTGKIIWIRDTVDNDNKSTAPADVVEQLVGDQMQTLDNLSFDF